jgi:O-antigen ligase
MEFIINLKFLSFTKKIFIGKQWIQFSIIAAVILMSAMISFWGSSSLFSLLLVLFGGIGVVLALLRQPNLGFVLVLIAGMFVPFKGPSGLNASTIMVALMLGLWILDMFVVRRNFQFIRSRSMIAIITFLVVSVLAFVVGQVPWFVFARQAPITAQVGGFAISVFSVGGLLLSAHLIKNVRWLKILVWLFLGLSAPYILGRLLGFPMGRVYQNGFVAQSMFWTWLIALAAGQIIYNHALTRRARWMLIVLVVLTFYVAVSKGYDWKSGWVPGVVALAVLLAIRYKRLIVFSIPFLAMAAMYVTFELIASDDYSWGTRVDAWRIILEISRISPLLGLGFANYYWYTPLFPIRGWRVSFNSHSQFVDLIAQTGYIGLLSFFWIFFEIGRSSWNLTKKIPNGFAYAYVHGVFAGIIATLVAAFLGDWVLPFVYNVGLPGFSAAILPWIFMGGVLSLEQMLSQEAAVQKDDFA